MPTPELEAKYEELARIRANFDDMLKEQGYYGRVAHPGDCFIIDQVLGLEPRKIILGSITKKGYQTFVLDEDGSRLLNKTGDGLVRITRAWDSKQKALVRQWWDLFSPEARDLV